MSSAHRPTWDPAKGRADERHKSARVSAREMPSHTKLKFRQAQPSTSSWDARSNEVRRDLKRELELAEREQVNKKRRERGLAPLADTDDGPGSAADAKKEQPEDEDVVARRRMIERLKELDDDEDDQNDYEGQLRQDAQERGDADSDSDSDSSESHDDADDDDEDETAALLRELEKIKRERAEEKERQERERAEMTEMSREEEIALGNPLLNLENALKRDGRAGGGTEGSNASAKEGGFGVKRRWDDDVIFKNQASGSEGGSGRAGFVNDLTRSEFHKRFMQRYVQ